MNSNENELPSIIDDVIGNDFDDWETTDKDKDIIRLLLAYHIIILSNRDYYKIKK